MTAVEISQALPFTCQQGLKIVQVASAGHCLLLTSSLCIRRGLHKTSSCLKKFINISLHFFFSFKTLIFIYPVTF